MNGFVLKPTTPGSFHNAFLFDFGLPTGDRWPTLASNKGASIGREHIKLEGIQN